MEIYDSNAEQAVCGSLLANNNLFDRVSFLEESDFYIGQYAKLFSLIKEAVANGEIADPITLESKASSVGFNLTSLTECMRHSSESNVVAHADIVKDRSDRRRIARIAIDTAQQMKDKRANSVDSLSELSKAIDDVLIGKQIGDVRTIDELINHSVNRMEATNEGAKAGLKTGIPEIDCRLGYKYVAFGEVTVIGGLSKNGKTLLANTITARVELEDDEVGHIFSIEMPVDAMFNAVVAAKTGVPANFYDRQDFYLKRYPAEYEIMLAKWGAAAQELNSSNKFTFDGRKDVNMNYVVTEIRKQAALARNKGKKLKYVMIDHLHRMEFNSKDKALTYAIRDDVRALKNVAAELGIAVILLCQLNNRAEGDNPTSFHILDSSSVRHELQAFVGVRMYRQNGGTYFGLFADSQRYADIETQFGPAYVKLVGGVMRSLPEGEYFTPQEE